MGLCPGMVPRNGSREAARVSDSRSSQDQDTVQCDTAARQSEPMNSIDGKSGQRGEPSAGSTREADVGLVAGFRIGISRLPEIRDRHRQRVCPSPPSGAGDASRKLIPYRDEIATTPVPPSEEATGRIERRSVCTSERLTLVVLAPSWPICARSPPAAAVESQDESAYCVVEAVQNAAPERRAPTPEHHRNIGTYGCATPLHTRSAGAPNGQGPSNHPAAAPGQRLTPVASGNARLAQGRPVPRYRLQETQGEPQAFGSCEFPTAGRWRPS